MNDAQDIASLYRSVKDDYRWEDDIMDERDERTRLLFEIVAKTLTPADRVLLITYTEVASFRKMSRLLGLSHTTCRNEIVRIRGQILAEYEKRKHATI